MLPVDISVSGGVAKCFEELLQTYPTDLGPILDILNMQTLSQLIHSLKQMQPIAFNTVAFAQENVAELVRQLYSKHFFEILTVGCPGKKGFNFWIAPFGENVRQHGSSKMSGYSALFGGGTASFDYQGKKWMVTAGGSYSVAQMHMPRHVRGLILEPTRQI